MEVKSGHFVPATEIMIKILHQLCEKVDEGILIQKLKVITFALSRYDLKINLMYVSFDQTRHVLLPKDGKWSKLSFYFFRNGLTLKDKIVMIELNFIVPFIRKLFDAFQHAIIHMVDYRLLSILQQRQQIGVAD